MAEGKILTTGELVRKALQDEHGDFVRDAVAVVAAQMMEAEISAQIGAQRRGRAWGARDVPQRASAACVGDARR